MEWLIIGGFVLLLTLLALLITGPGMWSSRWMGPFGRWLGRGRDDDRDRRV